MNEVITRTTTHGGAVNVYHIDEECPILATHASNTRTVSLDEFPELRPCRRCSDGGNHEPETLPGHVPNVLLSIEPNHADAILDGDKRWEYRRVAPAREPLFRVVLYAIDPVQAAVGACWVPCIQSGYPAPVVVKTIDETPHDADEIMDYFEGVDEAHALRVMGPRRFDRPVERRSLEAAGIAPSQNFRYLPDIDPNHAEVEGVSV